MIVRPLALIALLAALAGCSELQSGETTPGVITSDELEGRESPEGSTVSGDGTLFQDDQPGGG